MLAYDAAMESTNTDPFPRRPLSTAEVLDIQNKVEVFQVTDPLIGLESLEDGPGTQSRAVVGLYVGYREMGAYLMGFDPEYEGWETVSAIPPEDISNIAAMAPYLDELMDWIVRHHSGESLVMYQNGFHQSN